MRVASDPCILSCSLANQCYQAIIRGAVLKVTKCDGILWRVPRIPTTLPTANSKHHQRTNESVNAATDKNTRNTENKSLQRYNNNNVMLTRSRVVVKFVCDAPV